MPLRPATGDVVAALAEAARIIRGSRDDYPISLLHKRARVVVFAAMHETFTKLSWREIGRIIDANNLDAMPSTLNVAKKAEWWNDVYVDHIVGKFTADYYGERAR